MFRVYTFSVAREFPLRKRIPRYGAYNLYKKSVYLG